MNSIQNEMNQIQEQAIAEAEKDRSLRRRLQYSAETLVRAFASSGRAVPRSYKRLQDQLSVSMKWNLLV